MGKNENKYALEFVEYYKKIGVDKIIIYDNNDINGETFKSVLFKYIESKYVEIIDYRGKEKIQIKALNNCYNKYFKKFDWFIFFDMDEFLFLKNYRNIKLFLKNKKFKKCKVICLNEVIHTDNNQIYYINKTLSERFKEIDYNASNLMVKSILKGNLPKIKITNNHVINLKTKLKTCNGFGDKMKRRGIHTLNPDYKNYFFHHYYSKSAEEYLDKLRRGSVHWGNSRKINLLWLSHYFGHNKITLEKIKYFESITGIKLNISKYLFIFAIILILFFPIAALPLFDFSINSSKDFPK
jgi:hypothetical protein